MRSVLPKDPSGSTGRWQRLRRRAVGATVVTAAAGLTLALIPASASADDASIENTQYVALGDSYTSGAGAGDYDNLDCLRSDHAHPVLYADQIGADLDFAACSGATIPDVRSDQMGSLSADTDLVTLGIGGNDTGWVDVLISCGTPFTGDCWDDIDGAEDYVQNQLPGELNALYGEISEAAPNADVVVTGYPRLFNGDNCSWLVDLSYEEQMALNDAADLLNETISSAASSAGFSFADVRSNFDGHAVCDDVEYLNGLAAPIVKESFHPNADGQNLGYLSALQSTVSH